MNKLTEGKNAIICRAANEYRPKIAIVLTTPPSAPTISPSNRKGSLIKFLGAPSILNVSISSFHLVKKILMVQYVIKEMAMKMAPKKKIVQILSVYEIVFNDDSHFSPYCTSSTPDICFSWAAFCLINEVRNKSFFNLSSKEEGRGFS